MEPPFDEVFVEVAEDEDEECPACDSAAWLLGVTRSGERVSWTIWCEICGKPIESRDTNAPGASPLGEA